MSFESAPVRGVTVHYGPRTNTDRTYGGEYNDGLVKQVEWVVDYTDRGLAERTSNMAVKIPANAVVLSAKLEIIEAFTSTSTTTDLTFGLGFPTNTDDPDGLITAAEADQTTIATVGNVAVGAGAFVNATIGDEAGSLTFTSTVDDLLTGSARLIVEYIDKSAH